ncbi:hypothetical protein CA831_14285 [Burkholderia multivorans]|jgi:hypothetical protein|nr:hypothetical protein CA831_14285 [Burkholderia multivorans]
MTASVTCFSFFNMIETGLNGQLVSDKSIDRHVRAIPWFTGWNDKREACPARLLHIAVTIL